MRHHPRQFGTSKYGLERIIKVVLDLMVVKFLDRHFVKPIYVFGGFAVFSFALAGLAGLYMLYLKFFEGLSMIQTPLPLLSASVPSGIGPKRPSRVSRGPFLVLTVK